ncbi:ead/Ea22-like family protein [Salmonella enterica]|nr:ead/Ea22-like family protein [Salmonella enterica]EAX1389238.1 ead/Ea22-like family protein [Salmonella enterica]
MSNIDKQALREVAEKATKGPWTLFSDIDTKTFSIHTPRDKRCENVIKWGGFDCQPNAEANAEFIAAFNPKVALALLDENIQLQREKDAIEAVALALRDDMRDARGKLEAAEHRIAEQSAIVAAAEKLVRCKGRYHSELNYRALAKLFGVITPDLPPLEHENVHYADAAEVEITALRQRIAELEARQIALPQRLSPEGYHIDEAYMVDDAEGEYLDRDAVIEAISAAGIKVKES